VKELEPYFFKRKLIEDYSGRGVIADSVEKCPIGKVPLIGIACIRQNCCKKHSRFMHIVKKATNGWIKCEATTKLMLKDPSLGQQNTCVVS